MEPKASQNNSFDVFLSFKGSDARQGLLDVLCDIMKKEGIRVYREEDELEIGDKVETILQAIEGSQICVPIFSGKYASSKSCLQELTKMVRLEKEIVPIFYKVSVDDVKLKTPMYMKFMKEHEVNHGKKKVEEWKDALKASARFKGREVSNKSYTEFCKEFVKAVSMKLNSRKESKKKESLFRLCGMGRIVKKVNPKQIPKALPMDAKEKQKNIIVGSTAVVTFLLSLPVLASVVWLFYMRNYDCEELLRLPKLQKGIGFALLFVFLVSNVVVFLKSRIRPAFGFLLAVVPLIVMLIVGLAFLGADKTESRKVLASPAWLRAKIYDDRHWSNLKSCIYDTDVCNTLVRTTMKEKSSYFNMKKLSSLELGCCKPPSTCNMVYVNATVWRNQDNVELHAAGDQATYDDSDCKAWGNDPATMCYNCESCREGYLSEIREKWWKLGQFLVVMSLLLIVSQLMLFLSSIYLRSVVGNL